jgi:hypothetical protein
MMSFVVVVVPVAIMDSSAFEMPMTFPSRVGRSSGSAEFPAVRPGRDEVVRREARPCGWS